MTYTEKRKGDRAKMAAILAAFVADKCPAATVEIEPEGQRLSPYETVVRMVFPRGFALNIDFDGKSYQPDIHVLSWHTVNHTNACYSYEFTAAIKGSRNDYHFQKATQVCRGFDDLLEGMGRAIDCINSGLAYDAEKEALNLAKKGTPEAQAAYWEQCRQEWARPAGKVA